MPKRNASTDAHTTTQPLPRTLLALRTEAFLNGSAAGLTLVAAGVAADQLAEPRIALVGILSIVPALRAAWLWGDTRRYALALPELPDTGPGRLRRLWWWITDRRPRPQPRPVPEPFRRVPAGDDEVLLPRQPAEMRREAEQAVIGEYTASDVYYVVCLAGQVGLSERAKLADGRPAWQFGDGLRITLPSGAQLSRDGFRAIQTWLVENSMAVSKPGYALIVTPETVLEALPPAA